MSNYFYGVPMEDIMNDIPYKRVNIPKKRKPSLRKIRRRRKYVRLYRRVTKNIAKSDTFRKAVCDMILYGRSETYINHQGLNPTSYIIDDELP